VAVAEKCLEAGVTVINDTSAGKDDPFMADFCARHQIPIILMHRRGKPKTMQKNIHYSDVIAEVLEDLLARVQVFLEAGLAAEKICMDPGIGFGKRHEDNLALTRHLSCFTSQGYALLYAASRKSFVGKLLSEKNPLRRDAGSVALAVAAARAGADWVRVHAVQDTCQAFKIFQSLEVC
jgi:dihydropteroate synthase